VEDFPGPKKGSVFYEDEKVYACLAFEPVVDGHAVVSVKRTDINDIGKLPKEERLHLLKLVFEAVRPALIECYRVEKVYVVYIDELCHPHFHLYPRKRGEKQGFYLMTGQFKKLTDLSTIPRLHDLVTKAME
jgi:diadenosine tetraphosphate (Ap4A) HIT family hydrolase